jgi:hypothetical protein
MHVFWGQSFDLENGHKRPYVSANSNGRLQKFCQRWKLGSRVRLSVSGGREANGSRFDAVVVHRCHLYCHTLPFVTGHKQLVRVLKRSRSDSLSQVIMGAY